MSRIPATLLTSGDYSGNNMTPQEMNAEIQKQVAEAMNKMSGQSPTVATTMVNGKKQARPVYPKNQVVYNYMDHDFTGKWDSRNYTFKAGCVYRVSIDSDDDDEMGRLLLNESIPRHFARDIAIHYIGLKSNPRLARKGKTQIWDTRHPNLVEQYTMKALTIPSSLAGVALPAPVVDEVSVPKKRMGRPPKAVVGVKQSEEFEGVTT
jgi:hypothetical protein